MFIKRYKIIQKSILFLLDIFSIIIAAYLSLSIRIYTDWLRPASKNLPIKIYLQGLTYVVPIFLVLFILLGLYSKKREKFGKEVFLAVVSCLIGTLMIAFLTFAFKVGVNYSRLVIGIFGVLTCIIVLLTRTLMRGVFYVIHKKGYSRKNILVIGAGILGEKFVNNVILSSQYDVNVVGYLDDDKDKIAKTFAQKKVLGRVNELPSVIQHFKVEEVVVALPLNAYEKLEYIVEICEKEGVRVKIIPDYYKYISVTAKFEEFEGMPILNIRSVPLDNIFNRALKRAFDIVFSLLAIIAFSPIMLFVAIGVKLSSPGPILFKQERVGVNNRPFNMYKFRSMRVLPPEQEKIQWTTENDPRKTKFGSFIRKTSLDELPQLFNVLFGDMSLVGPRPERPFFVDKFKEEIPQYMLRHYAKAGITGWAQVNGWRGDTSIAERIKCDLYYIENWSLWLDIKIMFLTVFKGFVNKNAY